MELNSATAESQLLADIEALRPRFPNTQDMYREVCTLMFFRYGMTPTANRLYQLVRKGSMSAPAEALNRFWAQLREKSRVVIGHPDLPEELKNTAGELVASLWKSAQQAAADSLASLRAAAEQAVDEARKAEQAARLERDTVAETLATVRERLAQESRTTADLRRELAELGALHANQTAKLDEARKEINAQHAWLNSVQREHEVELNKVRDKARLDIETAEAGRRHASAEAERERADTVRLQQTLDTQRAAAAMAAEQHRAELRETLAVVADLRQQVGALQAAATATLASRDEARQQLDGLRSELAGAVARAGEAEGRAQRLETELRHAGELYEARLAAAAVKAPPPAPTRKARRSDKGGGRDQ